MVKIFKHTVKQRKYWREQFRKKYQRNPEKFRARGKKNYIRFKAYYLRKSREQRLRKKELK